jgi:hypothetical protein
MRRELERFQRIDVQMLVDPTGELRPEPRDRLEQLLGCDRTAQTLELGPAPGADHLRDRQSQHRSDARQRIKALDSLPLQKRCYIFVQRGDGLGRAAIGAYAKRIRLLLLKQLRHLAQPLCDLLVQPAAGADHPLPRKSHDGHAG